MSTLVIKNLPEPLHDKLREQAARNHRSMTKEALSLIEEGVNPQSQRSVRLSPIKVAGGRALTDDEFEQALSNNRYSHYRSMDEVVDYVRELRSDRDDVAR